MNMKGALIPSTHERPPLQLSGSIPSIHMETDWQSSCSETQQLRFAQQVFSTRAVRASMRLRTWATTSNKICRKDMLLGGRRSPDQSTAILTLSISCYHIIKGPQATTNTPHL